MEAIWSHELQISAIGIFCIFIELRLLIIKIKNMEAAKSLRRPSNWQDFETLCKKLWGEIWECPEVKKNGRSGQNQHGVDIYGIPSGEDGYYGIQCKGKDEYTNKQFSEDEIDREINNAKEFQPKLKKLYFATTAVKDSVIEEFIRKKNIENRSKKLFEVHIFSWEDIVELIDENKSTHDWYLSNQKFKLNKSVTVCFQNNASEILLSPRFIKNISRYIEKAKYATMPVNNVFLDMVNKQRKMYEIVATPSEYNIKVNYSYVPFNIVIKNTGDEPIEDYKLFIDFLGNFENMSKTNKEDIGIRHILITKNYSPTTFVNFKTKKCNIIPLKNILVGDDFLNSENIYIKPYCEKSEIILKWKLISKNFKDEGELKMIIEPDIEIKKREIIVQNKQDVKVEEIEVLDCIIKEKSINHEN